MSGIELESTRWLLLTEQEAKTAEQLGSFNRGFRRAFSAQTAFFPAGTLTESLLIANDIDILPDTFPSKEQIRPVAERWTDTAAFYRYEEEGDIWRFAHTHAYAATNLEKEGPFHLIFEDENQTTLVLQDMDEVRYTFDLFTLMNGSHSLVDVITHASSSQLGRRIIQTLVENDLIFESNRKSFDPTSLPEFLFLGHSCIAVRDGDDMLLVDPVGTASNVSLGEPGRPFWQILEKASAILITHHHWDHLHLQTLARCPKDKPMIVPKVANPTYANPSLADYLRWMGFTSIQEVEPWGETSIGAVTLKLAPFRGEPFGLNSRFDAVTYFIEFAGQTLFGSVDACHDESGSMDELIPRISAWGQPDIFLFGSSGQRHMAPCLAAGPRHFSNELKEHPGLIRYHPEMSDALRWANILKPKVLVPYAEFLFGGYRADDVPFSSLQDDGSYGLELAANHLTSPQHQKWHAEMMQMNESAAEPMAMLQPMQGLSFQ